jgi:type 2 lantibiotic biosynthesis protein LanM
MHTLRASRRILSDQERSEIARGATGLFECLTGKCGAALASAQDGRDLLRRWAEAFSPGDRRAFERRLAWDALDEATVIRALVEPAWPVTAQPAALAWTTWLDRFLEQSSALAPTLASAEFEAELDRLAPTPEPPFLEVWVAVVRAARKALADTGEPLDGIQPGAYAALERSLVTELSAAGEMVLYQALGRLEQVARPPGGTRYASFVRGLLEGGLLGIFKAYPVLARQLAVLVSTWVESTLELLVRLRRDRDAIAAFLSAVPLGEVCLVFPGLSDRHDGGRRVAIVTFTSGVSVVYKPRDVGQESALHEFQTWLSKQGLHDLPRVARVLEREGYGWAEFVEQEGFRDLEQVQQYFRRAGTLLGIVHVLRATDAHQENVIATRQGPALIDAEMLLQPVDRGEEADSRVDGLIDGAAHGVRRSCLSPGLVTLLEVDAAGACFDVGGLMPATPRTSAVAGRSWRSLRSDDLCFVPERIARPAARNQVVLDGVVQRPQWFTAELLSGFARAYRFFLAERPRLLDPEGPLSLFAGRRSRILFRPSDQYGAFLQGLAGPRYQGRGLERSVALEMLNRVFRHEDRRPRLWPLVADERRALEELDVPRYLLPVDECVLTAASGERVREHMVRSGLDAVMAGLRDMSEEDLALQVDLLGSSLDALAPHLDPRVSGNDAEAESVAPEATCRLAAELLGDLILSRGRRGGEPSLAWSDCDSRGPSERHDLYRGRAGIALFLAALAAVTKHARFADAAAAQQRPFETLLEASSPSSPEAWPSIGACSGVGSVVYALATAGRLLGDSNWTELALRWAETITPARIEGDLQLDVAGGTAGALLGLLSFGEDARASWLDERVRQCARRLLDAHVATGEESAAWPSRNGGMLTGFAHGAAGIAYALSRACAVTGDVEVERMVRRAHHHERRIFSSALRNWPADQQGSAALMTAWCYGAPGIGLARALEPDVFRDDVLLGEVRVAMETTAAASPNRVDHLCCGNMGRSEALLTVGTRFGETEVVASGLAIAGRLAESVCAQGGFGARTEGFEHRTFHPGFFRGLAGIGYQLLRTAAPSRLPSVLAFEPAVRAAP